MFICNIKCADCRVTNNDTFLPVFDGPDTGPDVHGNPAWTGGYRLVERRRASRLASSAPSGVRELFRTSSRLTHVV